MEIDTIIELYLRDLNRLKDQIAGYRIDADMWVVRKDIANSAGNLCLHLVGNLQHFIGAVLGKTGYVRDRHAEFHDNNIDKEVLIARIERTKEVIKTVLSSLNEEDFKRIYPREVLGKPMTTFDFIIHLYGHLNYHLGQVNYHRRLLDDNG